MGAALAYYTLLSLAPLLVLVIRLLSMIWDAEGVRGELVQYLAGFMGKEAAEAVQSIIQNSVQRTEGIIASLLGLLTLAWGATSVIVIMVWVYYSAQLFFFGAVFTRLYAMRFGANPQNLISRGI